MEPITNGIGYHCFEITYKELKLKPSSVLVPAFCGFEITYKELKQSGSAKWWLFFRGFEITYKELKLP